MDAATLNCPTCGAAAAPGATQCNYCHARLATVACPACFGLVFAGSVHCAHCGARVASAEPRRCPRGCGLLRIVALGDVALSECGRCGGVWVDDATFRRLCADREQQAALLGPPRATPAAGVATARGGAAAWVRYAPCPECRKLMDRVNFARSSGVVVDACKAHGVWFDEDELPRVVEFVRDGGLDRARAIEKEQLEDERRRLSFAHDAAVSGAPAPLRRDTAEVGADSPFAQFITTLFGTF
jgi:Zn-finger nucleic acid-binding protein